MNILFLIIGLVVGYVVGLLFTKSKNNEPQNNDELNSLRTNKAVLEEKLKDLPQFFRSIFCEYPLSLQFSWTCIK